MSGQPPTLSSDRDVQFASARTVQDNRSLASKSFGFGMRGLSAAPGAGPGPGSFNPDPKATFTSRSELNRPTLEPYPTFRTEDVDDGNDMSDVGKRQAQIRDQIKKEVKIKMGSENMLEALNSKNSKHTRDQRARIESELNAANLKIAQLKLGLEAEMQRGKEASTSPVGRLTQLFQNAPARSPSRYDYDLDDVQSEAETESPTFLLAELLQTLEDEGRPSEYYVKCANDLVSLFKRYPTLKYDLAWSIFGLRVQTMLLSDNDKVVAAGYRVMRYAIPDLKSLRTMRALHTDYLVMLSLVKGSKATLEREQALKFVRAFLDVKDGVDEISKAVLRVIVAVAEHSEDRLKGMCILTLAEILVRNPSLLSAAGGLGILLDALSDGAPSSATMLVGPFAYLLDTPVRRQCLRSGGDITGAFATLTERSLHVHEDKLQHNAKIIIALLKTWPGLITLSMYDFAAIRSLTSALAVQTSTVRDVLLDILFDVLGIKPPSWSSSFLAGRRLTTYGRVANLNSGTDALDNDTATDDVSRDLLDHFTAITLAVFLRAGLVDSLVASIEDEVDPGIKKKATLLLGETLHMAMDRLPSSWAMRLQVLPGLFSPASVLSADERFAASGAIYQIDSINRILSRSEQSGSKRARQYGNVDMEMEESQIQERYRRKNAIRVEEGQFRYMLIETQVLNTVNFTKWKWDLILKIIEGPLREPKRIDEAVKATKFVKRLLGFLRPFKYRFSDMRNTKVNQRYVRIACALMRSLLVTAEGKKFLAENKLLRQIAECLAQVDRTSGLTSASPLFSRERVTETLTGGYFAILGVLSGDPAGWAMLERWKMANMFYHIIELQDRNDLIEALLGNMDYSLDSHLRIILSKAMTSCNKPIRIFATRLLRKHATKKGLGPKSNQADAGVVEWAINLLITQLYDPEVEVCETAVRILEEACNETDALEYVVQCRPALDHLGEIGAPLLLRFLSTSMGYRYLDGLDYISQEMDDWFLGRNDVYVTLVEASLAKAFATSPGTEKVSSTEAYADLSKSGTTPPHFYRELARTTEGCRLLENKGHFDEFASVIRTQGMESDDSEVLTKVKGCLWAVGNVGSMELGAPFLETSGVVKQIIHIAERSNVMSMRGTAMFVLGLISRSIHGQEILAEHGWEVSVGELGQPLGVCLPADLTTFFSMISWTGTENGTARIPQIETEPSSDDADTDPIRSRVLPLIKRLGFVILIKDSVNELRSIKANTPHYFQEPRLFEQVTDLLQQHHFQLPVLRFVYDLFDKSVMRRIVLEEDSDDDDD